MDQRAKRTRLTVADVAERLNISVSAVRTLIRSGELVAIDVTTKPGAARPRLRIDLQELERFEKARSTRPLPRRSRSKREAPDPNFIKYV